MKREVLAPPHDLAKRESLPPPSSSRETPVKEMSSKEMSSKEMSSREAPPAAAPVAQPTPTPLARPAASEGKVTVPATPHRFVWPVKGKILVPCGPAGGGQKSDGIDIQAATGEPVRAADGGTVVYAGSEVASLGNLVLIQHPGGYITAYGNNEALLVKKGDTVKKGQTIAKAGKSGGASSPRVHFEVRRGGSKTVDPLSVLPAP